MQSAPFRNYEELAETLNAVRTLSNRISLLGISFLHPRHPCPPQHLELLSTAKSCHTRQGLGAFLFLKLMVRAVWESGIIFLLRVFYGKKLRKAESQPTQVIVKSWCFGMPSHEEDSCNFYFGNFLQMLEEKGKNTVLMLGDVARKANPLSFCRELLSQCTPRCVPEHLLLPMWAPFVVIIDQLKTWLFLRQQAHRSDDVKLSIVCSIAASECLATSTMRNTLHYYTTSSAVRRWNARAFVTLYEGQPWETLAWRGAKNGSPHCVTIGYQHTALMPHSLELTKPSHACGQRTLPDVVLCLGETTRAMMSKGHAPYGTKLLSFGSLRLGKNMPVRLEPRPKKKTLLVMPEGIIREAALLTKVALTLAELVPEYHIVLRYHPILPFSLVRRSLPMELATQSSNIEVSDGIPFEVDLARASVVLYRGSTAVLYAVMSGLKPIYLHYPPYPDVDPLFQLSHWKVRALSPDTIAHTLRHYTASPPHVEQEHWRQAVRYAECYTQPVNEIAFDQFLAAAGLC